MAGLSLQIENHARKVNMRRSLAYRTDNDNSIFTTPVKQRGNTHNDKKKEKRPAESHWDKNMGRERINSSKNLNLKTGYVVKKLQTKIKSNKKDFDIENRKSHKTSACLSKSMSSIVIHPANSEQGGTHSMRQIVEVNNSASPTVSPPALEGKKTSNTEKKGNTSCKNVDASNNTDPVLNDKGPKKSRPKKRKVEITNNYAPSIAGSSMSNTVNNQNVRKDKNVDASNNTDPVLNDKGPKKSRHKKRKVEITNNYAPSIAGPSISNTVNNQNVRKDNNSVSKLKKHSTGTVKIVDVRNTEARLDTSEADNSLQLTSLNAIPTSVNKMSKKRGQKNQPVAKQLILQTNSATKLTNVSFNTIKSNESGSKSSKKQHTSNNLATRKDLQTQRETISPMGTDSSDRMDRKSQSVVTINKKPPIVKQKECAGPSFVSRQVKLGNSGQQRIDAGPSSHIAAQGHLKQSKEQIVNKELSHDDSVESLSHLQLTQREMLDFVMKRELTVCLFRLTCIENAVENGGSVKASTALAAERRARLKYMGKNKVQSTEIVNTKNIRNHSSSNDLKNALTCSNNEHNDSQSSALNNKKNHTIATSARTSIVSMMSKPRKNAVPKRYADGKYTKSAHPTALVAPRNNVSHSKNYKSFNQSVIKSQSHTQHEVQIRGIQPVKIEIQRKGGNYYSTPLQWQNDEIQETSSNDSITLHDPEENSTHSEPGLFSPIVSSSNESLNSAVYSKVESQKSATHKVSSSISSSSSGSSSSSRNRQKYSISLYASEENPTSNERRKHGLFSPIVSSSNESLNSAVYSKVESQKSATHKVSSSISSSSSGSSSSSISSSSSGSSSSSRNRQKYSITLYASEENPTSNERRKHGLFSPIVSSSNESLNSEHQQNGYSPHSLYTHVDTRKNNMLMIYLMVTATDEEVKLMYNIFQRKDVKGKHVYKFLKYCCYKFLNGEPCVGLRYKCRFKHEITTIRMFRAGMSFTDIVDGINYIFPRFPTMIDQLFQYMINSVLSFNASNNRKYLLQFITWNFIPYICEGKVPLNNKINMLYDAFASLGTMKYGIFELYRLFVEMTLARYSHSSYLWKQNLENIVAFIFSREPLQNGETYFWFVIHPLKKREWFKWPVSYISQLTKEILRLINTEPDEMVENAIYLSEHFFLKNIPLSLKLLESLNDLKTYRDFLDLKIDNIHFRTFEGYARRKLFQAGLESTIVDSSGEGTTRVSMFSKSTDERDSFVQQSMRRRSGVARNFSWRGSRIFLDKISNSQWRSEENFLGGGGGKILKCQQKFFEIPIFDSHQLLDA